MIFFCCRCNQEKDFDLDFKMMIVSADGKRISRMCKSCRSGNIFAPDVYWDGKPEEGLADDPVTGKPRVFFSAGQKAQYLKERGLQEAGDKFHGAPLQQTRMSTQKNDSRHQVMEALHKVKQMGKLYRKTEYQKIVKERERYA